MSAKNEDVLLVYTDDQTNELIVREESDIFEEINKLKSENNTFKKKYEDTQLELNKAQISAFHLNKETETIKETHNNLLNELEILKKINDNLSDELNKTQIQLTKETGACSKLRMEIKKLASDKLNTINQIKSDMEQEKSSLLKKFETIATEINNKQNLINQLTLQLGEEKQKNIEFNHNKSELSKEINQLRTELNQAKVDLIKEKKISCQLINEASLISNDKYERKYDKKHKPRST